MVQLPYDVAQIDLDDLENDAGLDDNIVEFPNQPNKSDTPRSNLEVALHYADAGAYVFAARSSINKALDKRPMFVRAWSAESTRDHATIKRFFNDSTALVAVDCGKSRIVVIDADRHGGPDGVAALKAIVGDDLTAIGCPIIETAGGGLHLVFAQPFDGKPFGNGEGALKGRGINVRGAGGYVIGLGSVRHDGRSYRQMTGTPDLFEALSNGTLPQVPEALADLIRAPKETGEESDCAAPRQTSAPSAHYAAHHDERIRAWTDATFAGIDSDFAAIVEGGRNNHLAQVAAYRYGRYSAGGFISKSEAWERCKEQCQRNGLWASDGPNQCLKSFENGFAAGFLKPHPGPEDQGISQDDKEAILLGDAIAEALIERANRRREQRSHPDREAESDSAQASSQRQAGGDPLAGFIFDGDASLEPPPMLVKKLIPLDGICFIGGQSGAGKTFVAVDLAVSLAGGEPFFGHKVAERVGVAIFAAEGASTIASRVMVARNRKALGEILPVAWLGAVPNLADVKEIKAMGAFAPPMACASAQSSAIRSPHRSASTTRTITPKPPRRSAP
ncbi:MAG TPA: bifunctional DNA primase/polymerase [Methylocystis sp.]|jgi:hypothetical protein